MLASLKKYKKRFQEKSTRDILEVISKRLFPLFVYKEYFLYEEENLVDYQLKPKLEQTRLIHFLEFQFFKKYLEKQKITLLNFDASLILCFTS